MIATTDPLGVGVTISTYDGTSSENPSGTANILKSSLWLAGVGNLAPAHRRIPLRWNGGNPGSGAAFALSSGDADAYIKAIKRMGTVPYIVFMDDNGGNAMSAADAGAFVHHHNDNGGWEPRHMSVSGAGR
jgi:hypothetical protein